jgi:tetratricopeptide (TPR) repeat protein
LEDGKAKKIIEDVKSVEAPFQESPTTAYTLAAVEGRYALERQEWAKAASLQARQPDHLDWDRYPEFEALMHFAIGLGGARGGHPEKAEGAIKRLEALEQKTGNPYWVKQIEIQKNTVKAWLAFAKGQHDKALEWMTLAASQENATNKHAITPGELLTASELLGDMLMELEKPDEALVQYELALDRSPRRFNCLYGAGRAAELAGDHARAKAHYEALLEVSADAEAPSPRRDLASNYLRETPNKI